MRAIKLTHSPKRCWYSSPLPGRGDSTILRRGPWPLGWINGLPAVQHESRTKMAWTIAKPLLVILLIPLAMGFALADVAGPRVGILLALLRKVANASFVLLL